MTVFDNINPESFQMEMEAPDGETDLTEEDMQEVEIFNCSLCHDKFNTHIYRICEDHKTELLTKIQ
jgi:hypothetical protein